MANIKILYLAIIIFVCASATATASNLYGFWQTVDQQTHLPTSVIAVYPYRGKIYGKIVANFDKQGVVDETIYNPRTQASGLQGQPYFCGLDIVWATPSHSREPAKGQVVDPRNGKVYTAKLWVERGNLILRGELMMFGKNEVLLPFPEQNLNTAFQKPDLYQLTPSGY